MIAHDAYFSLQTLFWIFALAFAELLFFLWSEQGTEAPKRRESTLRYVVARESGITDVQLAVSETN